MPKLAALAVVAFGIFSVWLVSVAGAQVPPVANRLPAPAPPAACQIASASLTSDALPKELTQKEPPPGVPYEVRTLKKSAPRALNIFEIGGTQRPGAKLVALTDCTPHIEITDAVCLCVVGELACVYSPDDCCDWRLCGGIDDCPQ